METICLENKYSSSHADAEKLTDIKRYRSKLLAWIEKIISKRVYKRLRSVNPKVICEPLCKKDTTNKKMQCVYHETTYDFTLQQSTTHRKSVA